MFLLSEMSLENFDWKAVDIIQERSSKHERELRAFKKRLDKYTSTKEAIYDQFFSELIVWSSSVE